MIKSFGDKATESLYHGHFNTREVRQLPTTLFKLAARKLDLLNAAVELRDLFSPPGNRLEKLSGDYQGQYSIRVNDQFRIVFHFSEGHAYGVRITDYH